MSKAIEICFSVNPSVNRFSIKKYISSTELNSLRSFPYAACYSAILLKSLNLKLLMSVFFMTSSRALCSHLFLMFQFILFLVLSCISFSYSARYESSRSLPNLAYSFLNCSLLVNMSESLLNTKRFGWFNSMCWWRVGLRRRRLESVFILLMAKSN